MVTRVTALKNRDAGSAKVPAEHMCNVHSQNLSPGAGLATFQSWQTIVLTVTPHCPCIKAPACCCASVQGCRDPWSDAPCPGI